MTEPELDPRRRALFQIIEETPGIHLRELERRLGFGLGDLRHHLDALEGGGLISSRDDGYRKTFFPVRGFPYPDARLLALLRQEVPRRILLLLLEHREREFQELRDALKVSKSTLSFHLKKVTDADLVTASRVEGRMRCRLADPRHVADVLLRFKDSFLDAAIDRVVRAWIP